MRRLLPTMRLDVKLQARSKLYHIGIVMAIGMGWAGRSFVSHETLKVALPLFYLVLLGGSTYIFVAGMVLFERGERTLDALKTTPVRLGEYLGSKTATLTAFSVVEGLIVLLIAFGPGGFRPVALIVGLGALGVLYTLIGLAQVARHESVTDFLVPGAMIVTLVLQLPLFDLLDLGPSAIWYAIPTRAPLLVIEAGFRSIESWEWAYAIGYGTLAIGLAYRLARSQFARHLAMGGR